MGSNCQIGMFVTIGENCIIGDNAVIEERATLKNCTIGNMYVLTDTFIGSGTKLDALVHVAHNVRLGTNCQLAAGTIIGGSTVVVGDSCWTRLDSTLKIP